MAKIKKGDKVVVITGKDKGAQGAVLSVLTDGKILVEGINQVKKHQKPNPMRGLQGGVVTKEMPIDVSNVQLFNPKTNKADRVGFKLLDDGKKVRVFKSTGEQVDA